MHLKTQFLKLFHSNSYMCNFFFQDLGLANNAAKDTNSAVNLGQQALEIYTKMTQKGYGGKDFSVIFKILQEMSGPEVEKKKKEFFDQWKKKIIPCCVWISLCLVHITAWVCRYLFLVWKSILRNILKIQMFFQFLEKAGICNFLQDGNTFTIADL